MKRVVATTWYAVHPEDPWHSSATMPGFTLQEAIDTMKNDGMLDDGYVPLTAEEQRKFAKAYYNSSEELSSYEVFDDMRDGFKYYKYIEDPDLYASKVSYSFWVTGASGYRDAVYAYGADTVGGYEFNLKRIAKNIGSRAFYEFFTMAGKRFKTYTSLVKFLQGKGIVDIAEESKLIEACNEDRYYLASK